MACLCPARSCPRRKGTPPIADYDEVNAIGGWIANVMVNAIRINHPNVQNPVGESGWSESAILSAVSHVIPFCPYLEDAKFLVPYLRHQ